jgi:hypothetical protein
MTFVPPQQSPNRKRPGAWSIVSWLLYTLGGIYVWHSAPHLRNRGGIHLLDFEFAFAFFGAWVVVYTIWEMAVPRWPSLATPEYRAQPVHEAIPPGFRWFEFWVLVIVGCLYLSSKRPDSGIHVGLRDFVDAFAFIFLSFLAVAIWQAIVRRRPPSLGRENRSLG